MKIGFFYDPNRQHNLDLITKAFEERGHEIQTLKGCLCMRRNEDLSEFGAVIFHLPHSEEGGCAEALERYVRNNPLIHFYFLDIFRRLHDSGLARLANVTIFDRYEGAKFVSDPDSYFDNSK